MIRLVLIQAALFLSPFAVWLLLGMVRRKTTDFGVLRADAPWIGLAIGGLLLVIASLLALSAFDGGSASGHYVPDRWENGRLIPGHIE